MQQTSLRLGMAFGDGPARALSQQEIADFDTLSAPYWYDLGHLVVPSAPPALGARIHEFMVAPPIEGRTGSAIETNEYASLGGLRFGISETPARTGIGHAAVAGDALTFTIAQPGGVAATAFTTEGVGDRKPASGAVMSWHPRRVPAGSVDPGACCPAPRRECSGISLPLPSSSVWTSISKRTSGT